MEVIDITEIVTKQSNPFFVVLFENGLEQRENDNNRYQQYQVVPDGGACWNGNHCQAIQSSACCIMGEWSRTKIKRWQQKPIILARDIEDTRKLQSLENNNKKEWKWYTGHIQSIEIIDWPK